MTAISAWPSMAGKMSKIHQGYSRALRVGGAIRNLLTRWLTLELSQPTGDFDLQQERSLGPWQDGATVPQIGCRSFRDESWMIRDVFGHDETMMQRQVAVERFGLSEPGFHGDSQVLTAEKEASECSNKKGYEWMSCWLVLRING